MSTFKVWSCYQLSRLPTDVQGVIADFLRSLYDVEIHRRSMKRTLNCISNAYSRKRGYIICAERRCECDGMMDHDQDEHWAFWTGLNEDIQFQAISCNCCGEFRICHTPGATECRC